MRWSFLLWVGLLGCEQEPFRAEPPAPLMPRPIPVERTCEQIITSTPGALWEEAGVLPIPRGDRLVVVDPSVLGGPFEEPLRTPTLRELSLRILRGGDTVLCVQLRAGHVVGERRLLGRVGIDTGMLLLGGERSLREHLASAVRVLSCAEATSDGLTRLESLPSMSTERWIRLLPTLSCIDRAPLPDDARRIRGALRQVQSEGRFSLEPQGPAWAVLRAMEGRPWAFFPKASAPLGVVIEVSGGDGAYPVWVVGAREQEGSLLEIPLR
ncbi:MAG: hypothetical protein NZX77_20430 [Polyangiaceae bacterium]|nr:hypothetical protein [Polyangiaceae bacterium]